MFDRVILRVTEGGLKGQAFVLEKEANCILGRSGDCSIPIRDPLCLVSRHHCRIKASEPVFVIQDLGSLNGTYVNGEKIGQRGKEQSFEEALQEEHVECPLWEGDQLRIGDLVFRVEFDPPAPCSAAEPRDQQKLWSCDCASCC